MLLTLLFQSFGLLDIFCCVLRFITVDSIFLLHSRLVISLGLLLHLLLLHHSDLFFVIFGLIVSVPDLHDLDGFFLRLFNLFPCLKTTERQNQINLHAEPKFS